MGKLRVRNFSISLDGYAAGPGQSLEDPLGIGGACSTNGCLPPAPAGAVAPAVRWGQGAGPGGQAPEGRQLPAGHPPAARTAAGTTTGQAVPGPVLPAA